MPVECFQELLCSRRGKERAKAERVLHSACLAINDSNHIDSDLAFSALPTRCCCCHALRSAAILRDSSASSLALLAPIRGGTALQLLQGAQGCRQRGTGLGCSKPSREVAGLSCLQHRGV